MKIWEKYGTPKSNEKHLYGLSRTKIGLSNLNESKT